MVDGATGGMGADMDRGVEPERECVVGTDTSDVGTDMSVVGAVMCSMVEEKLGADNGIVKPVAEDDRT
jgi:hypothetical protein